VTDTGTGMAPEIVDRIFDPFFTTKQIGKGTGLGLATVLGIVRGHEGFVRVDSKPRQGTTFELYLPAAPEVRPGETAAQEASPPCGHGEMILVVDDEAAVRESLRRTLEKHGYRVAAAAHGNEGLAVYSKHAGEIRAVLTDLMMPVMNGPATIAALRQINPNMIILGMTGLPGGMKGMESLNLGAVLTKPFSGDELLRALHSALR
jgi:CheY-like chemotaxis protein